MNAPSRYRVVRRLGRGGMAEVLEAVATGASGFERRVAIKRMLPATTQNDTLVRMFLDEARTASHLHHGNIVAVIDFGVLDGLPFQVLEFMDGTDGHRMSERPLPPELALYLCTEIGHALDHAHQARDAQGKGLGIVHRDVKPSNILVSWSGDVKLGDFGVAFARDRIESTLDGSVKGTPLFMAPEQMVRGQIDARTDLFALGCVLHFFVTGESPLAGDRALADLMAGRELALEVADPEVREIVARAVRRDLGHRYASAADMTRAMGSALAGRLKVDARSLLRDWLAPLRAAPVSSQPRGKLDELLNLEIIPGGQEHVFVSRVIEPTVLPRPPAKVPRRRWLPALGGGALLVGVVTAALVATSGPPPAAIAPPAPPPVVVQPPLPPVAPRPSPEVPASTPQAPVPSLPKRGSRQVTKGREAVRAPAALGAVAFGGSDWVGSEVLLDGLNVGYAPKLVDVPVGKHSVDLIAPNGRHSGPGTVVVTDRHTPLSPLHYPAGH